ncbi:hypothetical protein BCR34DRAFT_583523 [Clohesyomyces aquaticus]|uniref:WHIM1 domain-containing protein n=1 Tax=Clohesyomyces aquaticus TaxID=1231657 RepID=A0A1Y2A5R1_9PLEO|nr:hypothetical protein BCR34DRAFT_583523 [Clohesyomyces aquaticus]
MADSDSSLSSPPSTDDEMPEVVAPVKPTKATPKRKSKKNGTILSFFDKQSPSPVRKKRPASPPHEMVPEDNPDIPFIVMFRSRFMEAFPPKCPHLGPQDIERGVADSLPSPHIESLLCALLGLVLNRKKPVEKGHYGRALEEAIQTQKHQWPRAWSGANPLSGGRSFNTMSPSERLTLLKSLILWSLHTSEVVSNLIKEGYKARSSRDKNDVNIPLSVQPWGRDGDKRRYWLIEGQDDTAFRVYRESNPVLKNISWWSVAGSIDELRTLAQKLENDDGTKEAKSLSEKMLNAIPRFEATEEKRKRREYRMSRKAAFAARPEPGFSLYEGRTRGKRMKYTFSDEEEDYGSDALSIRRSTRQTGRDTPTAPAGPTVTASGRQVRSRAAGLYGESLLSGQTTEGASPGTGDYVRSDASEEPRPAHGRSTRAAAKDVNERPLRKHIETYNSLDEMDDEEDASSSGGEWGGDDEDDGDQMVLDDDEDDEPSDEDMEPKTLVVRLRVPKGAFNHPVNPQPVAQDTRNVVAEEVQVGVAPIGPPVPPVTLEAAPAPPPAAAPPPQLATTLNGVPSQERIAIASVAQGTSPLGETYTLPKLGSPFAPTPPYVASEDAPKTTFPVAKPGAQSPFSATTLPNPTPASTWQ